MAPGISRLSRAVALGAAVTGAPLVAACASEPTYDEWAATDGAAGRINLDDVQAAFKSSESATEFEQRVNEIYEGDGIVLIRAQQDEAGLTLEGWEDLDNSNDIDSSRDDLLFSITKRGEDHELRGYHANSHYYSHFGAGDFLFAYLLLSSFNRGPYFYHTPIDRGPAIRQQRTTYRGSTGYRNQAARNSSYATRQQGFAGSRYQDSRSNLSSNRQSYQQTQRTSGAFRTSSSVSRSRSAAGSGFTSSRSRSGSFSGGGGQVRLVNPSIRRGRDRH